MWQPAALALVLLAPSALAEMLTLLSQATVYDAGNGGAYQTEMVVDPVASTMWVSWQTRTQGVYAQPWNYSWQPKHTDADIALSNSASVAVTVRSAAMHATAARST